MNTNFTRSSRRNAPRAFGAAMLAAMAVQATPAEAFDPQPVPYFAEQVASNALPPIQMRAPAEPLIVDLEAKGREVGVNGGTIRTLIGKAKNIRYMVVWGYARLVGYDDDFNLRADILKDFENVDDTVFTLTLREGHRWSDGHPFTTEAFRYWWEDVANDPDLSPSGAPSFMLVNGDPPEVEILSETQIRFSWKAPNPAFLTMLAQARPPFIYRPGHYLKKFHAKYTPSADMQKLMEKKKMRNWAQLHNRYDNSYKFDNPALPTLQPWLNTTGKKGQRFIMARNPYYHRFDTKGQQLPYADVVEMSVSASSLFPAKAQVGQVDLLARGLNFMAVPLLKKGEAEQDYSTRLWPTGFGSDVAIYPNLNTNDPVWRELNRDRRFRRALSLGIDRRIINRTLYFGLAKEVGNGPLPHSPLYDEAAVKNWARYDPAEANRLLDEIGLTKRRGDGIRLLPDGRPLEIIVETAGERSEEIDALQLVTETWREIGVKLFPKPSDRDILRNRAYTGSSVMTVWSGWDLGVPTANSEPRDLAPVDQGMLIWPKWGQFFQTKGKSGERPDTRVSGRLMELYHAWRAGVDGDSIKCRRCQRVHRDKKCHGYCWH